jgi:hypothetical protein
VGRVKRLLLVIAAIAAGWVAALVAMSESGGHCNPDDLTGCDGLASLVLWLALGLPVVLFLLGSLVVLELVHVWGRRTRRTKRRPPG